MLFQPIALEIDDAVRFGRVPKREKAKILAAMQSSKAKVMESRVLAEMSDDRKIIDTIVRAHYDTCDYTTEKMKPFKLKAQTQNKLTQCTGQTCPMKGGPEQSFLEEFSDRFMDHVRQVCTFAKCIPGFKCLQHDDQVTLLKSCVFEVLTLRLSGLFDNQSLVCLNGDVIRRETISAMPAGNAKFLMDSVFELAQRINRFHLSDAEIGLFCSVVIISADRPGLRNVELVGRMQDKLKQVLENVLVQPAVPSIYSQLVALLQDLRTLNTLHTEKFLQQAKVTREEVCSNLPSSLPTNHPFMGEWEDNSSNVDGDSTGSRSPQSSDSPATSHSFSLEDLRRSPGMGSVSSTESIGNSENFSKLSVNDLKIHGSVLLNALTSPALSQLGTHTRKRDISRLNSTGEAGARSQEEGACTTTPSSGAPDQKCPFKTRKLDSPSDSGIDSPKAQGSQSTNTSVCSSPRSSMEEVDRGSGEEDRADSMEEQHPLLKRALQQPPQPFNSGGGVTMFQDEVYKPHKKFRHSGRREGDEPTSTQDGLTSPGPSLVHSHSILASQLAAPPSYTQRRSSPPPSQSLLATTLSRPVSAARGKREEERSELLANLILDSGRYRPAKLQPSNSLLMCAPLPAHVSNIPAADTAAASSWSPPAGRHLPVPVAPVQPTSTLTSAAARLPTSTTAAPADKSLSSSQLRSALTDSMPLNLSVRTPPPPPAPPALAALLENAEREKA